MSRTQTKYTHQSLLDFHQWCFFIHKLTKVFKCLFYHSWLLKRFSDRWLQFHGLDVHFHSRTVQLSGRFTDTPGFHLKLKKTKRKGIWWSAIMWNWNQLGSVLQTISSSIEFYCISLRRKLQTSVEESCLLPGGKTPLKASTECWTTPVNISKTEIIRNTWTFMFWTVFLCFASLLPSLQLHASALLRYKLMHIYLYSFLSVISLCPISY